MVLNKFALGAIAMVTFGTIYNIVAVILPMWASNKTVNSAYSSTISSTNFKAGLLGFCVDTEMTDGTSFDDCFYYKFGSLGDNLSVLDSELWSKYTSDGVCKGYDNAGDVSDAEQFAYSTVLATAAGMNAVEFDKFLDKSCGMLGMGTMTTGGMSLSNGLMALIAMVGAITCSKGNKKWTGAGYFLVGVAALTSILTIILWIIQSKPLGEEDDTSYKASFFLMIIATLHYLGTIPLFWKCLEHQRETMKAHDEDHTTYMEAETPINGRAPTSLV
ncbi:unnamed protein product [Peronospora belbahrii]|uniref:Sur7 protein n=1 Tax=Peronospora belbahrii TaxID=622444 RepID=A0AAU9KWN8_9STRA|nr:unnamed protein product [Peronospora belbahrii]CAH0517680.1 unnamed protein product [Peronospora belbahrii]